MKKSRRVLWIGAILGAGIGGLVLLLALPRVQTAIARRVLTNQLNLQASLAEVHIGLNSIEVTNFTLVDGPLKIRIPSLLADVPIWRLWQTAPHIARLEAKGWDLQWDGLNPAAESADLPTPVSTAGWTAIFAAIETEDAPPQDVLGQISQMLAMTLPVSVGQVDLAGNAVWRDAGPGADGQASVSIMGTGPAPNRLSDLRITISALGESAGEQHIQSLAIESNVKSKFGPSGRMRSAETTTSLRASRQGRDVEDVYGLSVSVDQREGSPRLQFSLSEGAEELFSAHLAADSAGVIMEGGWGVKLSDVSLRNLMLGRDLPEFNLVGTGALRATAQLDEVNLSGDLRFEVVDVSQLTEVMAGVGDISGNLGFEIRQNGGDTRFTRMDLEVAGAAPVLEARLLQGIEIGAKRDELRVARPDEPVISCRLLGLPLSWIQPAIEPWVIDARPIEGQIVGLVTAQGLRFVTSNPIRIEGAAVANQGESYVDEVDIEIDLGSEITTEGWQVELGRVEIFGPKGRLVNFQARGGRLKRDDDIMKLVGRIDADLAGMSVWPGLSHLSGLRSGQLHAEFGVGVEERLSIATAVSITDLVSLAGQSLPNVDLDGRVDLRPDNSLELHLPVQITADGRASDLTFNLRAEPEEAEWMLEGSLSGPRIYLQDLQTLSALMGDTEPVLEVAGDDRSQPGLSPVQSNANRPVWAGLRGSIQTALGEIVLEDSPSLSRLEADIVIEPTALRLDGFSLAVGEAGSVRADASLQFDASHARPYRGMAGISASDVAVEPWLRWIEPDSTPVMEGNVNLTASWQAEMRDLSELANGGQIKAEVSSTGGVLRALGVDVESYVQTGQTVAALGALFGALTNNPKLAKQAQRVQAATNVAERLSLVTFDQLSLNIERGVTGDVVISDLSLIAPALRLIGEGRITYRDSLAFWLQPLALKLNLSARDDLGLALLNLGLVKSQADALGYLPLVTDFNLDGSLANIGTAELQRLLVRAFSGQ
tara:strand:- start:11580 stop:14567 length:2988 start_codon:yes stop_codon:yes gene_type:complete